MPRRRMRNDMTMMNDMNKKHWMMHKRMKAVKLLILGILVLANWYFGLLNWAFFIGLLAVLAGLVMLIMPGCKHCGK